MARQIAQPATPTDIDLINLNRLLNRLQHNVLSTSAESRVLRSRQHRARVGANLEYARALLLRLEQSSSHGKDRSRKQAIQANLSEERELIKRLNARLNEFAQADDDDASGSEGDDSGEDLLGECSQTNKLDETSSSKDTNTLDRRKPSTEPGPPGGLRPRHTSFPQTQASVAVTTSSSLFPSNSPISTTAENQSTSEALASHNSEQETLTNSLLELASQIKSSSLSFAQSLESEKPLLSHVTDGLDTTTGKMEATSKQMGVLKRMSEGRGWLGRIMLYAWIFGLMVVAVLIVFVGPKFRL